MREIKFRAWSTSDVCFVSTLMFNLTETHIDGEVGWEFVWPNRFEVMQYTGMKDKSGKEIYEGDIVNVPYRRPVNEDGEVAYYKVMQQVPCVITFDDGYFWPKPIWGKKTLAKNIPKHRRSLWRKDWCEIVGNIYENPELLKGEANENNN